MLDEQILQLCRELCGGYEWVTDEGRADIRAAVIAMRPLLSWDEGMTQKLDTMLADAVEDAALGRGEAELENWRRDLKLKRAKSEEGGVLRPH